MSASYSITSLQLSARPSCWATLVQQTKQYPVERMRRFGPSDESLEVIDGDQIGANLPVVT